jgi:glycosyltransferase involved in cell wall biosynthesis
MRGITRPAPLLIYLVTEDWYFLSHRLPMATAAKNAGYSVHVVTNVTKHAADIEALGFQLHPVAWQRGSLNPFRLLSVVLQLRGIFRRCGPDIVHNVAMQPVVLGSIAALGFSFVRVNAIAGLGYSFSSGTVKAQLLRPLMATFLRFLLRRPSSVVLTQNSDDRTVAENLGVPPDRIFMVRGSGVDIQKLYPQPEPAGPITATFVGRLLGDKGIRALIAAHDLLGQRGETVQLKIAGDPDPANPAAIPAAEIEGWKQRPDISVLGHVSDIAGLWAASHIAVLPSWREGLPKSLLEAAACGRPIVATDVPGCREIARNCVNALLVPVENPEALAEAIQRLAGDRELRVRFGAAGRQLVEREFSSARIGKEIVALYDRLLGREPGLVPVAANKPAL